MNPIFTEETLPGKLRLSLSIGILGFPSKRRDIKIETKKLIVIFETYMPS